MRSFQIKLLLQNSDIVRWGTGRGLKITLLGHLHFDCQCICYWCLEQHFPGAIASGVSQFFLLLRRQHGVVEGSRK